MRTLGLVARLRAHDRWSVAALREHQQRLLRVSIAHALASSPFYGPRPSGATSPQHWGGRFGATVGLGIARTLALDVRAPVAQLVAALNRHRPVHLGLYPSIATTLAGEQLEGRLRIAPRAVSTSGEMLTPEVRERMRAAWGREPFDGYATTETGFCGLECTVHRGIHLLEDLTLLEVVDDAGEPAGPGTPGARVLVTNLFARTLPVIRYELSDMLTLADAPCPCGRPFRLIDRIAGRSEDVLVLPGRRAETVRVHPTVLTGALERVPGVRAFQVVRETGVVRVNIVVAPGAIAADVRAAATGRLGAALDSMGAAPTDVRVEPVDTLERTGVGGKLRIVVDPAAPKTVERAGS